jgi:hypothetical protein
LFGSSLGQVICGAILAADLQLVSDTAEVSHTRFLHELIFQLFKGKQSGFAGLLLVC